MTRLTKLEEMEFLNDYTGEYAFKNEFGEVTSKGFYKEGNKHGIWHEFRDGEISTESTYVDGVKHGLCKTYARNSWGDNKRYLSETANYKNGVRHGETVGYYTDGTVSQITNLKNGLRHGAETHFNEDGSKIGIKIFFEGDVVNIERYENDVICATVKYLKNGLTIREYTEDGESKTELKLPTDPHTFKFEGNKLAIGCQEKTIAEWDVWFAGEEVIQTERGTDKFEKIEAGYNMFKDILVEQNAI